MLEVHLQEQLQAIDAQCTVTSGEQLKHLAAQKAKILSAALADLIMCSHSTGVGFTGILMAVRKHYNTLLAVQAGIVIDPADEEVALQAEAERKLQLEKLILDAQEAGTPSQAAAEQMRQQLSSATSKADELQQQVEQHERRIVELTGELRKAQQDAAQQRRTSEQLSHQLDEVNLDAQEYKESGRHLAVLLAAVAEGRCTGEHILGSGLVDEYLTGDHGPTALHAADDKSLRGSYSDHSSLLSDVEEDSQQRRRTSGSYCSDAGSENGQQGRAELPPAGQRQEQQQHEQHFSRPGSASGRRLKGGSNSKHGSSRALRHGGAGGSSVRAAVGSVSRHKMAESFRFLAGGNREVDSPRLAFGSRKAKEG